MLISLGPGSASGKKDKKQAMAKKKKSASEAGREVYTARLAWLADIFSIWPRFLPIARLRSLVSGYMLMW